VFHGPDIPALTSPSSQAEISSPSDAKNDDAHFSSDRKLKESAAFNQSELNDLVRDLGLTEEKRKTIGVIIETKKKLAPGKTFCWYRNRDAEFNKFFMKEDELVYCCATRGRDLCLVPQRHAVNITILFTITGNAVLLLANTRHM
jgi:hypothetical protein